MNQDQDLTLNIDPEDQCYSCFHYTDCPIINGLSSGAFFMPPHLQVKVDDCYFYQPIPMDSRLNKDTPNDEL